MSTHAIVATGAYSRSGSGRGTGVELMRLVTGQPDGAPTVEHLTSVELENPTFLLWSRDGSLLYAVLETSPSRLVALRVGQEGTSAEVVADLALQGEGACHLAFGHRASTLVVADYGSGTVETVKLDTDGIPQELVDFDSHGDRADGLDPHPHQVVPMPGTELLAVPDLGLDRVFLYAQDSTGQIDLAGEIPLRRGSGPRHLAADHESEQLHISCERSGMIATAVRQQNDADPALPRIARGAEYRWAVRSMEPASRHEGTNELSHLELTADEGHLLVANRGPDTLSLLSLVSMRPSIVDEIEVGAHPRHFAQRGDLVLVAAQEADRIDLLRVDGERLSVAAAPIEAPSVACIAVRP
ncbi:lactonase family protein [Brachybacterium muris]|uniref:3-carboxymuconate cyclase n=2 Tax=Brachybacterium TaxID=43668 RepID=A0A022KXN9_9MICO|nr:beta-propeller fold lactonase family protein [Brachybacterium muris]EYT51065.1 3-carboxymuconate cyclase [Brachybacterium muris UCD-AY4]MBM7501667.1 6-phosphogluconolactonase (cycloisomerase 2 family) [Brachybacterium muris]MCT1996785.1 lactonase family protein [Brachybacterium muris]MCT2176477.1 lactonase family protein [Brachybacterium muris]MCT2261125.1 lactonase family protein [Brachybacterium muris]